MLEFFQTNTLYLLIFFVALAFIFIPWLLAQKVRPFFGRKALARWLNNQKSSHHIKKGVELIDGLYMDVNPFRIAKTHREANHLHADHFLYGEMDLITLSKLLKAMDFKSGLHFCDLGSGAGRSVLMVEHLYKTPSTGIELVPPLYELATHKLDTYVKLKREAKPTYLCKASFIHGDFLEQDLSQYDVIMANATAFKGPLWDHLKPKLSKLKIGTKLILTTLELNDDAYQCIYHEHDLMSWGFCTTRIYEKVR